MQNKKKLFDSFYSNNIKNFVGVPDSLLSNFSKELEFNKNRISHIIAPNEGSALSIAIGSYMTSNNLGVVYLQNSGLGNIINPFLSLAHKKVWSVPIFFVIGWRGYPKIKDEPQHISQGAVTTELLDALKIKYLIAKENDNYEKIIEKLKNYALKNSSSVAILFPKKYVGFDARSSLANKDNIKMTRFRAIKAIIDTTKKKDIVIATTGKTARELYLFRKEKMMKPNDLYVVGGMGHASSIALGILENVKNKKLYLLDGDGAFLMHMGIISLLGKVKKNNFLHILLNNNCHDSVGGQPTPIDNLNLKLIAKASQYDDYKEIKTISSLISHLKKIDKVKGSHFLNIKIAKGSIPNLPRPKESPKDNIRIFKNLFTV